MKGMELPINALIIIVIAVIILLLVVAFLFGAVNPNTQGINQETAKNNACQMVVSMGCNATASSIFVRDFDANKNKRINDVGGVDDPDNDGILVFNTNCNVFTTGDNLATLCLCYYGINSEVNCINTLCGCGR